MLLDGKVAFAVVTKKMLRECEAEGDDTEGLVEEVRRVEGTSAAVFMRELDDGWKFSLRAKEEHLT